MTASHELYRFALGLQPESIPVSVIEAAKLHILDGVGVGFAASTVPLYRGWADGAARIGGAGSASVFGHSDGLCATAAAMANGALMHSLEYDDTHIASVVHGGAVAVPVALAIAQEMNASGGDLIAGYLAAWEVMIRLGLSAPGAFQANGFQITAVGGAIGAALAAARIQNLSKDHTVSALGIAGSQASGLMAFLNDGSTVKALHPGWAAHTGIAAAALAASGMTGPEDVLEGRFGVFDCFAGDDAAAERFAGHIEDLGAVWHMPDAAFKLYPCCHYIHPFLEALEIVLKSGIEVNEIAGITCHVPQPEAPLICEPWSRRQHPASGYDGKWALAYCLAALLKTGRVDVGTFAADPDPQIVDTAQRISWQPMKDHVFPTRFQAQIDVRLTSGEICTQRVENAKGAPGRPIDPADIAAKFRSNAGRVLGSDQVDALQQAIMSLDTAPDLRRLSQALTS